MRTSEFFINNVSILADTLRLDIDVQLNTGAMKGAGDTTILLDEKNSVGVKYSVLEGYRFLNDEAGVLVKIDGWFYNLFAYSGNQSVYVVMIDRSVKLPNYNMRSFVDLSKIDGIMGAMSRRIDNAVWIPIKQVGHQQL